MVNEIDAVAVMKNEVDLIKKSHDIICNDKY